MEINRTGGQLLIEALRQQGTDHVFCVPGESFLSALDGLHGMESIRTVICRQEGGAAMMADAYGKLTHRPGCVLSAVDLGQATRHQVFISPPRTRHLW